ncbi:MAG: hypothetical protein WAU68_09805 [Vitreimonas sp.]
MRGCKELMLSMAMLIAFVLPAFALDQDETHFCRNGAFADEAVINPMRVIGAGRVYLRWDGGSQEGCPGLDACRHGYVVAGQEVLVGKRLGDFACAYYAPSGSAGFVPAAALAPMAVAPPAALGDWVGHWSIDRDEDATIDITLHNGALAAEGEAYWPGRHAAREPNEGGFGGTGTLTAGRLNVHEGGCEVSMRRVGAYLIATDNFECGGANVRFNGVYSRISR